MELLISQDAIHWTVAPGPRSDIRSVAALGSTLYTTVYDPASSEPSMGSPAFYWWSDHMVQASSDGGRTWQTVTDASGQPVHGDAVWTVDGRILAFAGDDLGGDLTWVGP